MPNTVERSDATREGIERRAYELYEARGRTDGHDWDDWLQAERELQGSDAKEPRTAVETPSPSVRRRRNDQAALASPAQ
jgi:hypothetical protein